MDGEAGIGVGVNFGVGSGVVIGVVTTGIKALLALLFRLFGFVPFVSFIGGLETFTVDGLVVFDISVIFELELFGCIVELDG